MIYGYVRVSTDKQSTENQCFEIENYSKAKGFRIERWVDETISGTTSVSDRQLGRLLKQILLLQACLLYEFVLIICHQGLDVIRCKS